MFLYHLSHTNCSAAGKKSHDHCSQSRPAIGAGFPPFLVSTPSSRANWPEPSSCCEKGTKETMQSMAKLVDVLPSWSFIKYLLNTRYVLGLGEPVVSESTYVLAFLIWNHLCPGLSTSISSCREGNCHILSLRSFPSTGSRSPTSSHFPTLPAPSVGSVMRMPAQQSSPGKRTTQLSEEVSISS